MKDILSATRRAAGAISDRVVRRVGLPVGKPIGPLHAFRSLALLPAGGEWTSAEAMMKHADPISALLSSVLVLNRYYLAVHVVNVRRAFGLLYRDLAEVIDLDGGQYAN